MPAVVIPRYRLMSAGTAPRGGDRAGNPKTKQEQKHKGQALNPGINESDSG